MKRGLKVAFGAAGNSAQERSRAFPDEEGTESLRSSGEPSPPRRVPEPSPMKRGLKGPNHLRAVRHERSSRAFPDEEGTESFDLDGHAMPEQLFQSLPR